MKLSAYYGSFDPVDMEINVSSGRTLRMQIG